MKRNLFVLLLIACFFTKVNAQQVARGEFSIGNTGVNGSNAMVKCQDGGYALTGFTSTYGAGGVDVYLIKLDSMFQLQWTKTIGGKGNESGYSIVQTKDRGFAITGVTYSFGDTVNGDVYVIKLDSAGNLKWTKTIGGLNREVGNSIVQTTDGGYAIAGYTSSYGAGSYNMYIIKLDSVGNLKWTKTVGGTNADAAYSIIQSKDGGYAITGYSESYGAGAQNIYLVKLDSAGNLKWAKTIGGTISDAAYSIIQTNEGGYAIAGLTESYGIGVQDVYVIKTDTAGNIQWTKTIADSLGRDAGYQIVQTKDKGYSIAAVTDYYNIGDPVGYVIKLDSAGSLKWTKIIGGGSIADFNSIVQSNDGGYLAIGSNGVATIYLEKLDSSGNTCDTANGAKYENSGGIITSMDSGRVSSGGSITSSDSGRVSSGGTISSLCSSVGISTISTANNGINIYPNPCNNTLNIDFSSPAIALAKEGLLSIQVLDITGRMLLTSSVYLTTYPLSLDVSSLSSGMYFIRVNSGNGMEVQKFIKE